MSWLTRSSPLRQSLSSKGSGGGGGNRGSRPIDTATECDPRACYDSFCKHWQQAFDIIQRSESSKVPSHDDVLGVVNHLDHMVTLLLVELHNCNKVTLPGQHPPPAPCLEFLLSENLLDKLYEWGIKTGRYSDAVRLEQLKLYELLVSHSRHQLLVHEPFLRPLLKLLASSQGEIFPPDIEKRLVILLNQLCVVLMQNVHLLDLFFFSTSQQHGSHGTANFIIFSLLIPYVHREGPVGHQARDSLLLCMSLSQKNSNVGTYIANHSSMSPVLVTGLGGLYSLLPNTIEITSTDWYRITPDDVAEIPELALFINALEFCNAVVQVAHELIKNQLLEFMYQGFLIPVLGPAILQIFKGRNFQTNIDSQISAMAYLDLIIRSITEPGLLKIFVQFLLAEDKFDNDRIIDVLVERLNSADSRLCIVTLSFFDTLLSLNCEDIMLEIILKYLVPCHHIPILHRYKINKIDPYLNSIEYFLDLTPEIMKRIRTSQELPLSMSPSSGSSLMMIPDQLQQQSTSLGTQNQHQLVSKTIGANWNHYCMNQGETLYANYYAYLFDAKHKIMKIRRACDEWCNSYKYQKMPNNFNSSNLSKRPKQTQSSEKIVEMIKNFLHEFPSIRGAEMASSVNNVSNNNNHNSSDSERSANGKGQLDSLQSIGESSGYESFKYRPDDMEHDGDENHDDEGTSTEEKPKESWKTSSQKEEKMSDLDLSEDLFRQGTTSLGPFLNAVWGKLQTFSSNCLYVNLHLTGLISHLARYPLPLIQAILLRPDIPSTSETPSFYQVLKILKQQMDAELLVNEESLEFIDNARSQLIDREFRLLNARKSVSETSLGASFNQPSTANISASTPVQLTPSSPYDPFKRGDSKRNSIKNSFSSMFRRPSSAGSQVNLPLKDTTNHHNQSSEPQSLDSLSSLGNLSIGGTERNRDLAICAVLLDEWLKELSAISQEQSIVMLADSLMNKNNFII